MGVEKTIKRIIAAIFVTGMILGFILNGSYDLISVSANYLNRNKDEDISIRNIENDFTDKIWKHNELIDLNGFMASKLHMSGLYGDEEVYVTDEKYIVTPAAYTTTDYEVEQTVSFRDFLKEKGINLLYVNKPTKYVDDDLFMDEFGIETYSNRNADTFLERIREAGINTIDLRDNMRREGMDVADMFYRTDHHWTVPSGLWAAKIMAEGLNDYCGYDIDTSMFDEDKFDKVEWAECWLGEQGRLVGRSYVVLDDFTELKPKYDTDYTFKNDDGTTYDGTFDDFVNEYVYDTGNDVYENKSWHYSYKRLNCINNNVEKGKLLMIGDSYDQVTEPFLSLQVHEVDIIILRAFEEGFDLRDLIVENGYDTVIISYAQFMIGAHDVPGSANYNMFSFDR